jgi:16S rRNA (uracil1498-N3)-methyltransferase
VDLFVVPWEEEVRPLGEVIAGTSYTSAAILIGPEGGLTAEEVSVARAAGGLPASLGPLILRTETAALATAAMLLYERLLRPHA